MSEILQRLTANSGALVAANQGDVILEIDNLKGCALSVTVDGTVGGTGSWTEVLIEVEYSLDNGTTWLAASDTIFDSETSAEVVTAITEVKGSDCRLVATTLTLASGAPTLDMQIEVRVI